MKKIICFLISLAFLFSCESPITVDTNIYDCDLSHQDAGMGHPNATQFQSIIDEMAKLTPGVQASVKTIDGLYWSGASGMADIPNDVAFQPCHKTMIGSISKIYTAVLIMQLQDEGILSVNDPLKDWLSQDLIGEIENANEVSLKQLLKHTSGIRDYLGAKQFVDAVNTPYLLETQEEKLEYVYGKPATHSPGAEYSYSNTNFVLLGLIIEKARDMTLWDAVDQYIVQPLGLKNTQMGTEQAPIPDGTARPYLATHSDKYFDIMQHAVSDAATGDGGIAANMQDVNAFMEGLFTGALLTEESLMLMIEDNIQVGEDGSDFPQWVGEAYGYGITYYATPYGIAYGHQGSTSSYEAYNLYFPNQGVALSYGFNGTSHRDEEIEAKEKLYESFFEIIFQ